MNVKNILCAVDLTSLSQTGNAHASALAKRYGATLHFVYVYEPVFADGSIDSMTPAPPEVNTGPMREKLEEMKAAVEGVEVRHELLLGFPAASLIAYAQTHDIDLIVLTTHGRTGASRFLLGSVAESVARHAPCPVLTVHEMNRASLAS